VIQAILILAKLSYYGISHRDSHTANWMILTNQPFTSFTILGNDLKCHQLKLIDFGAARKINTRLNDDSDFHAFARDVMTFTLFVDRDLHRYKIPYQVDLTFDHIIGLLFYKKINGQHREVEKITNLAIEMRRALKISGGFYDKLPFV
jgi:serine/threonine protein kinase